MGLCPLAWGLAARLRVLFCFSRGLRVINRAMHALANPSRFLRLAGCLLPWLGWAAVLLLLAGLWLALVGSPPDYQQGDSVRIMYVHVPAAYMAVSIYAVMAVSAAIFLIWKIPLMEMIGRASAPVGAAFTFICLVTGSLWGKPMWGTWWVWDARLTSVLILFFQYAGYIALANAFDTPGRGSRPAALLAVIGIVNLPIIKFSVDWWNTLHQPASLLRLQGPAIDQAMLTPLLVMMAAFSLLYLVLLVLRLQGEYDLVRARAAGPRATLQR